MPYFYVSDKITVDDVLREECQTYKLKQEGLLLKKEKLQLEIRESSTRNREASTRNREAEIKFTIRDTIRILDYTL